MQEVFATKKNLIDVTPFTSPARLQGFNESIFSPVLALDGTVEFVAGTTRDIAERMRSAQALLSSEGEQRQSAEQLQVERSRWVVAQQFAKIGSWETDLAAGPGRVRL